VVRWEVVSDVTEASSHEATGGIGKEILGCLQRGPWALEMTPPLSKKRMDAAVKGEYETGYFCVFVAILIDWLCDAILCLFLS
jgi:hypothetical protein